MAIWLPRLAIDRWRLAEGLKPGEGADAHPLALIADTAHGPRITAANHAGLAAGAEPGKMLADARAACPNLAVAHADRGGDLAFLENLALWAQRWGPWSAIDPPDGVIVDVTGVAHLFGGERGLLGDAGKSFACRRLAARFAVAPTAGAAWALAHFGGEDSIVWPEDDIARHLADLPVAALRLAPETVLVLRRLGLKRIGELGEVEREPLARRFRNRSVPETNPLIRMDQLIGRIPEPLLPVLAAQVPVVQRRLLEPIRDRALLDRVLADLTEDMVRVLEGRHLGVRRLELGMWRVDGSAAVRSLELSQPTREAPHIARLFAERLDNVDAGFGIELVRLRAAWTETLALAQSDIEAAAEAHGTSLSACLDRLSVRLGTKAVQRPAPHASHIPERAQHWQEAGLRQAASQDEFAFHARPLKLLDRAEPIAVIYATPDGPPRQFRWRGGQHEVVRSEGPERIAPEWWRERFSVRLRDYYRVEDRDGRRYWIYRAGLAGDGRGGAPEWFLQGLFA